MTSSSTCVILGGGGHARVMIEALRLTGVADIYGITDLDPAGTSRTILGIPIIGNDDLLPELPNKGVSHFVVGLGSTGDATRRARMYQQALACGLQPLSIIHPAAVVSPSASIAAGVQLLPGCIINSGVSISANAIINSGAIVEHDCIVGSHAHVASGACLAGGVNVGDMAHIGAGATVIQSIVIGTAAIVGAGAVVIHDVSPYTIVVGVPARHLRTLPRNSEITA